MTRFKIRVSFDCKTRRKLNVLYETSKQGYNIVNEVGSPNPRPKIPKSLKPRFLLYKNAILSTIFCPCRLSKKNYTPPVLKVSKNPCVQMFHIEYGRFAREDFWIPLTQGEQNFFLRATEFFHNFRFFTHHGFQLTFSLVHMEYKRCQTKAGTLGYHIKWNIL